ncbi:MAG: hypothetical protein ACT4PZ_05885 [Panacagrimonas sp.]
MPLSLKDLRRTRYDPLDITPRTARLVGVGGNVVRFDESDQVTHGTALSLGNIVNIHTQRSATGSSYFLPGNHDGISFVALPATPQRG